MVDWACVGGPADDGWDLDSEDGYTASERMKGEDDWYKNDIDEDL